MDSPNRKLFIGGLSWDTDESKSSIFLYSVMSVLSYNLIDCFADDLREYFKKYGNVTDVSIKYDAVSGNPRGFGFITFASEESIEEVLSSNCYLMFTQ